jgi:hypothetical protein
MKMQWEDAARGWPESMNDAAEDVERNTKKGKPENQRDGLRGFEKETGKRGESTYRGWVY